jgi:cation:H+ antiporter
LADLPLISVIELLSGLVLLILGAELMVRAAVRLAARLHVRPLIIGLTIVALGSSAPQMAVSLQATLAHNADIAVGSVIGSSIFNILVTLGLSALIIPLRVSRQLVRLDIPLMIGASLLVFVLAWNEADPFDGVILLTALRCTWACCCVSRGTRRVRIRLHEHPCKRHGSSLMMIVAGLAMLVFAGHLLLGAAVAVATDLGLSERIIGLTMVAVGTSLPELATSLIAACAVNGNCRGQRDRQQPVQPAGRAGLYRTGRADTAVGIAQRPGFRPAGDARRRRAVPAGVLFRLPRDPRRRLAVSGFVPGLRPARGVVHHRHATGGQA